MSVEDCGNVVLPSWSYSINTLDAEQQDASDPASRIAALLLAKLADYVVPGEKTQISINILQDTRVSYKANVCCGLVKNQKSISIAKCPFVLTHKCLGKSSRLMKPHVKALVPESEVQIHDAVKNVNTNLFAHKTKAWVSPC